MGASFLFPWYNKIVMNTSSAVLSSARFVVKELIGDFITWPVWWYSTGLVRFLRRRWQALVAFEASIGLTVWVINWTKPMFAQYDILGKAISLVMRTILIAVKTVQLMIFGVLQAVFVAGWLMLPVVTVWGVWHWLSA